MNKEGAYERRIVVEFLDAHGIRRPDGRFDTINEQRVTDSNRDMIQRWEKLSLIPLGKVDDLIMRYGFMLWELDHWAETAFLRTGYIDPKEIAA